MKKAIIKIFTKIYRNKKGITMPEILVGAMLTTIIASTGAVNALKGIDQANIANTISEMIAIRDGLVNYQKDHPGETVTTTSTLVTYDYLMKGINDAPDTDMETDYTEDAWNTDYVFVWPTTEARGSITSAGADKDITAASDNIVVALEKISQ